MTTRSVVGAQILSDTQDRTHRIVCSRSLGPHACIVSSARQHLRGTCSRSASLQGWPSLARQTGRQQAFLHRRRASVRPAAISADAGIPVLAAQQAETQPVETRGLGSLTSRILSGSVLGLAGGLIILAGGWIFTIATCLVAYQATQEYYGFITSKARPFPTVFSEYLISAMSKIIFAWA